MKGLKDDARCAVTPLRLERKDHVMSTKITKKERNTKAVSGIDQHFSHLKSLMLAGKPYPLAALKAFFLADNDTINAADALHTQWKEAVAIQQASNAKTAKLRRALRNYVLGVYGPDALGVLADFGFAAPRAQELTVLEKASALAKRRATREARHILGKRQRHGIKAGVPAPHPAPTPPAPSPAPGGSGSPSKPNGAPPASG
jgi:hypothetical protein